MLRCLFDNRINTHINKKIAGYTTQAERDDNIDLLPPDRQVTSVITVVDLQMENKLIKEKYLGLQPLQKIEQGPPVPHVYYPVFRRRK